MGISIHAPAWGATLNTDDFDVSKSLISIHAPAWGATIIRARPGPWSGGFQSTLPRGERLRQHPTIRPIQPFQSTLPRGERRPESICRCSPCPYFNPRSRVGSDYHNLRHIRPSHLFQSTLPRGERPFCTAACRPPPYFNPRSRVGSDFIQSPPLIIAARFQSTLPRGERRHIVSHRQTSDTFQSTLPRGERL